ncbi:MAG: radical SAM protein [Flavobacteriales bacterium]|nr:radical SAM protein [Flavobacteriales bacterium]
MIKISSVSYLNSLPFIYGIKESDLYSEIELFLDPPSLCADKLIKDEIDIGLVPVVTLHSLKNYKILSEYCIGSEGVVDTVCVFSNVPINQVKTILLDPQSRTSVELLKILLKNHWGINPVLYSEKIDLELENNNSAALVIGDDAFPLHNKFEFVYDLSLEWSTMTGMPFVFAVWVTNKNLNPNFIQKFNQALDFGVRNINKSLSVSNVSHEIFVKDPLKYLNSRISYNFDENKKKAMNFFLSQVS